MTTTHGGARPKRRDDDARGGYRPTAGALVRRLQLSQETARELRILALARLHSGRVEACEALVAAIIHAAWLEYDAEIQRSAEEAGEL